MRSGERLEGRLARLGKRWGPERVSQALRRAVEARRAGKLGAARAWVDQGLLPQAVEEIAKVLNARPPEPPSSIVGSVQALLDARGWLIGARVSRGAPLLSVRRAADARLVGEWRLESRGGPAAGEGVSILPAFHLRPVRSPAGTRLAAGLSELAGALCLLLESLRGRTRGTEILVKAETHEGGPEGIERILRITFACNHRCPFCFIPVSRGGVETSSLERELDVLAGELGTNGTLTLSGGEPTVDRRLPDIIASARRRGIRRFVLQTNGSALARPGLVERLLDLGVAGFDVSFHSHLPSVYDRITGSRGNHPKVVSGLKRLLASKRCGVTACVLITAWNYRGLPGLVDYLGRLSGGGSPMEICFALMNGAGMNSAARMAVDLKDAAPFLRRALARCAPAGITAQRFTGETALPVCLLPDPEAYAGEIVFSQERVRYAEDFTGETGSVGRAKRPGCRSCRYDSRCLGVPAEYARMFGLGALHAV